MSSYGEAERENEKEKKSGVQLLVATFKHMRKPYQLFIIPLTFWSGVEQGFFGADFTAVSFVNCHSEHAISKIGKRKPKRRSKSYSFLRTVAELKSKYL